MHVFFSVLFLSIISAFDYFCSGAAGCSTVAYAPPSWTGLHGTSSPQCRRRAAAVLLRAPRSRTNHRERIPKRRSPPMF